MVKYLVDSLDEGVSNEIDILNDVILLIKENCFLSDSQREKYKFCKDIEEAINKGSYFLYISSELQRGLLISIVLLREPGVIILSSRPTDISKYLPNIKPKLLRKFKKIQENPKNIPEVNNPPASAKINIPNSPYTNYSKPNEDSSQISPNREHSFQNSKPENFQRKSPFSTQSLKSTPDKENSWYITPAPNPLSSIINNLEAESKSIESVPQISREIPKNDPPPSLNSDTPNPEIKYFSSKNSSNLSSPESLNLSSSKNVVSQGSSKTIPKTIVDQSGQAIIDQGKILVNIDQEMPKNLTEKADILTKSLGYLQNPCPTYMNYKNISSTSENANKILNKNKKTLNIENVQKSIEKLKLGNPNDILKIVEICLKSENFSGVEQFKDLFSIVYKAVHTSKTMLNLENLEDIKTVIKVILESELFLLESPKTIEIIFTKNSWDAKLIKNFNI